MVVRESARPTAPPSFGIPLGVLRVVIFVFPYETVENFSMGVLEVMWLLDIGCPGMSIPGTAMELTAVRSPLCLFKAFIPLFLLLLYFLFFYGIAGLPRPVSSS